MSNLSDHAQNITKSLTPEAVAIVQEFGWDFFKAGVLVADDRPTSVGQPLYLLMREAKVKERQPDGSKKWVLSDQGKWNLPCGRLQLGESFAAAAIREGFEETGYDLSLGRLVHFGHRNDSDNPYVILIYTATAERFVRQPDPEEVAETRWFSYEQIIDLRDRGQLRNRDLTMSAIDQYRLYQPVPEGLIVTYIPKS